MSTFNDRPNTALLIVDVQNDVVGNAYHRDEVVATINALVEKARAEEVPVIWVQHSGEGLVENSDGWQYQRAPGRTAEVVAAADVTFGTP